MAENNQVATTGQTGLAKLKSILNAPSVVEQFQNALAENKNLFIASIIDLYNGHKPLARGYPVKYTDAWCSTFASAVAIKAGLTDIIPTECGCEKHIQLFKKLGSWQENDAYVPKPADYIFYDWQDSGAGDCTGAADHVGIVEKVSGQTITAIEGNTSPGTAGSQSNGGMVCRKNRPYSQIVGVVRPNYQKEDKHMDNTPSPAHKEGVEWALENGILAGNPQGDLMLSQPLTRQQFCTMLYRFAKYLGKVS